MRRIAFFALTLATIAVFGHTVPVVAKVLGNNGRILFIQDTRKCQGCHLRTINPDGTYPNRIQEGSSSHWSPDGSQIASVWTSPNGWLTTAVMDADSSNRKLFDLPGPTVIPRCIVWSADVTRPFCEGWDDERRQRRAGTFSVDATDGQDLMRLTANRFGGHDLPGDTSPNGTRIRRRYPRWEGTVRRIGFSARPSARRRQACLRDAWRERRPRPVVARYRQPRTISTPSPNREDPQQTMAVTGSALEFGSGVQRLGVALNAF